MKSKRKLCRSWKLYVITDRAALAGGSLEHAVKQAIRGGADAIQLRDKSASDRQLVRQAKRLLRITRPLGIPLLVNDRPAVAKTAGADGVHLGQSDGPLHRARAILGDNAIIGRSTHTHRQARLAEKEGFDYIAVGPVFSTPTKPTARATGLRFVRFAAKNIRTPFVVIGGIDASNVQKVRKAGAKIVAAVRAVMGAQDPEKAARTLRRP